MTSGDTLVVDRRPTRQGVALVVLLAAASVAMLYAATHPLVFSLLTLAVGAYTAWCVYRLRVPAVHRLLLHPDRRAVLVPVRGDEHIRGMLAGTPFVSPWLICLSVDTAGRRRSLCFFPDHTGADSFRRLAAYLKNL